MGVADDHRDMVTVEELAISNIFEGAALIEVLEGKGILTKAEVLHMVKRLKTQRPSLREETR